MRHEYPLPGNEHEFEDFCVRFYSHLLKRAGLVLYAKRGEGQDGIDIIDQQALEPLTAIQCKRYEPTKTLAPRDIRQEVAKAESSRHPVELYVIATTAKKSRNAQDTVLKLNQRPEGERHFTVEIHFWEDICTQLNEFHRAVADFIVYSGECAQEPTESPYFSPTSPTPEESEADDIAFRPDIDALFIERRIEAAEYAISSLPDPERDPTLPSDQRYAILRFKGKLALERLQYDESARLFLLAYETLPELEQAKHNQILALALSGKQDSAFAEAKRLLDEEASSPHLINLLISTASEPGDIQPFQKQIAECAQTKEYVNSTLAHKYMEWHQIPAAKAAAEAALKLSPTSAHALFWNAMVEHASIEGDWEQRSAHIAQAILYYEDAITAAERDRFAGLIPEAYTHLGNLFALASRPQDAAVAFRNAVRSSGRPSPYPAVAVSFFLDAQDYDSAWHLLPELDLSSYEAQFLTVVTEYHCAPDGEREPHIKAMAKFADMPGGRSVDARFVCVEWALSSKKFTLAQECVPRTFIDEHPFQGNTLFALIEADQNHTPKGRDFATAALESSSRGASRQHIATLARVLLRLDQNGDALPLLETVAIPGVLNDECKHLVECAQRLQRHDTLIRICQQLRKTDQQDDVIRKLEIQLLERYAPDRALELATEFRKYDEVYFTTVVNYLSVRQGNPPAFALLGDSRQEASSFTPNDAYLVVTPYVHEERFRDALLFLYQLLRTNFTEAGAHGRYIWFVLQYGNRAGVADPDTVDEETAVRLEDLATRQSRWIVIEDWQPDPTRDEFSSTSDVAQGVIGKRCGDVVQIRSSLPRPQERIGELQSKYIRLLHDSMASFQNRFPGSGSIRSLHVGSGTDFDPTPLIESLRERREHVEAALKFYRENLCSLHFLATQIGVNESQMMRGLAFGEERLIRCAKCSPVEFEKRVGAGFGAKNVVLDLTAIITLGMLDAWDVLDERSQYIISQSTADSIAEWQLEAEGRTGQKGGYAAVTDDGNLAFHELTSDERQSEVEYLQRVLAEVRARCVVKSSLAVADIDPDAREKYTTVCGYHSIESVCIARDLNGVLWTDDLFTASVAEIDFNVKRVWSQLAFEVLRRKGKANSRTVREFTAKLAAWNYVSTVWQVEDVIAAGRLCGWNVAAWPFKECIELFGKCESPPGRKAWLVVQFLQALDGSSCFGQERSAVITAVLDSLNNSDSVGWMLRRVFQPGAPNLDFFRRELLHWLRERES